MECKTSRFRSRASETICSSTLKKAALYISLTNTACFKKKRNYFSSSFHVNDHSQILAKLIKLKKGQQKQHNETNKGKSISHMESHFKSNLYACIKYSSVFSYTKAINSAMSIHSILLGNSQHQGQDFIFSFAFLHFFLGSVMVKGAGWKMTIVCVHWLAAPAITAGPGFLSSNLPGVNTQTAAPTCIPLMTCCLLKS